MYDEIILGDGCYVSSDCNITQVNNNILVVGASGSGKTKSITEPNLLSTYHSSIVTTFAKRKLVKIYEKLFQKRGYQVMEVDFANPGQSKWGYDPLDFIKSYDDISYLSRVIVMADQRKENSKADPYWDESAISLLSAVIALEFMTKKKPSMADVLARFYELEIDKDDGLISTNLDQVFNLIGEKEPHSFAYVKWKSFRRAPLKTASCVYTALATSLDSVFTGDLCKLMRLSKRIDFKSVSKRKTALFIVTSPVNPALNVFVQIMYNQMFKELFEIGENNEDGSLDIPVRIICDDFACGAKILNFEHYLSICREKGISVTMLLQSESQLSAMYGEYAATTIINNSDTYIYLGGNDIQTAVNVSKRANVPLEEILYMPVGKEVIFRRGEKGPINTKRYDIFASKEYEKLYKENITEQREKEEEAYANTSKIKQWDYSGSDREQTAG